MQCKFDGWHVRERKREKTKKISVKKREENSVIVISYAGHVSCDMSICIYYFNSIN